MSTRTELHINGAERVKIAIRSDGKAVYVEVSSGILLVVTEISDLLVVDYRESIWSNKGQELGN